MIDLVAIFGESCAAVPVAVTTIIAVPEPEAAPVPDDAGGSFSDWVYRADALGVTGWQAPDLPEVAPFDALPVPGPACPVCGSLEEWTDLLGGRHCQQCDGDWLRRALDWAERAARLREQSATRKAAARIAPGCVPAGLVDTLDVGSKRPAQGQSEGFGRA
ncbi:MAG: hypothetical protein ABFC96_16455 [Thermoguttaceae bacterium]